MKLQNQKKPTVCIPWRGYPRERRTASAPRWPPQVITGAINAAVLAASAGDVHRLTRCAFSQLNHLVLEERHESIRSYGGARNMYALRYY